jgi:glycosyltransferase involved in cell wall biosynthesis
MRDADIFVLPSLFEGTPLTLIEAMWSGLPVVTTATAGMKDVVSDQRSGLLVPPGDVGALAAAIDQLTSDAALRRRLGTEAHAVAHREYTWDNAAATFASAYQSARAGHE